MLILPPRSGSGKGGGLEDLLAADPHFLRRLKIRGLLLSSSPISDDLLDEIRRNGVEVIVNLYGSTEVFPTAISVRRHPRTLHLSQGHVFVEVVDQEGHHVRSGERGLVVVSRIGTRTAQGIGLAAGTQLFRLAVGDGVNYVDEPCPCGRTSPAREPYRASVQCGREASGGVRAVGIMQLPCFVAGRRMDPSDSASTSPVVH